MNLHKRITLIIVLAMYGNSYALDQIDLRSYQFKNPSFLTEKDHNFFSISYSDQLSDSSGSIKWSILRPVLSNHTVAFSHSYLFNNSNDTNIHQFLGTFAHHLWNRLSYGLNIGSTIEKSDGIRSWYPSLDLGVSYRLMNHPLFGLHTIGASLLNALTPSLRNRTWHKDPVNLRFSWMARIFSGGIQPGFDLLIKDILHNSIDVSFDSYLGFKKFPVTGFVLAGKNYIGVSAGLIIIPGSKCEILVSSQYITDPRKWTSGMLSIHFDSDFSNSREENFSRIMGRSSCTGQISGLYGHAVELYLKSQYFDALHVFYQFRSEYPKYFRDDICSYLIGSCYQRLGMLSVAKMKFMQTKSLYKNSPAVNLSNMGLLQIAIEENDHEKIPEYSQMVQSSIIDDSTKQVASFLLAEYKFLSGDFKSALAEYKKIKENHPDYIPAQYSIAAIYSCLNDHDEVAKTISLLRKNDLSVNLILDSLRVSEPVSVQLYNKAAIFTAAELSKTQGQYDSLMYSIELLSKHRLSDNVLLSFDSLCSVQKNYYTIVDRYRVMHNTLYKKWLMLGNDLLFYLTDDQLQLLKKCQSIIGELTGNTNAAVQ